MSWPDVLQVSLSSIPSFVATLFFHSLVFVKATVPFIAAVYVTMEMGRCHFHGNVPGTSPLLVSGCVPDRLSFGVLPCMAWTNFGYLVPSCLVELLFHLSC